MPSNLFQDSEPEVRDQPLVIPLRGSHTDAIIAGTDGVRNKPVPEFLAIGR